jgi:hypothetical protein
MGKHFIDTKRSEILSVFPCMTQIALFGQNCFLPFSSSSLDITALLKSWQKHYHYCEGFLLGSPLKMQLNMAKEHFLCSALISVSFPSLIHLAGSQGRLFEWCLLGFVSFSPR